MILTHTIVDVRRRVAAARHNGLTIGLVPTMGALHEGHLALVRRAESECGFVVVSIFVNPTQFGPSEDYERYPRTLETDCSLCSEAGVDVVFAPDTAEMYPEGTSTWVEVEGITQILEGASRPGHFRGVATVCTKLFSIVQPDRAYFGQKDYQQLLVIRKMVCDLNLPLEIIAVPTVREPDGLAMSSRNVYLSAEERDAATVLSRALCLAKEMYESGTRAPEAIRAAAIRLIDEEPLAELDYFEVVDAETLAPVVHPDKPMVALTAVRIGRTRLIDNTILGAFNST